MKKVEIVSYGSYHVFQHLASGALVFEKCLDEDYVKLGQPGGEQFNPIKEGHNWLYSAGGCPEIEINGEIKIAIPNLKDDEFVETGNGHKLFTLTNYGDSI